MSYGSFDGEIGGGVVRRRFTMNGESVAPGTKLTRDQILAMPINNRRALVRNKNIDVFPPAPIVAGPGVRHVVHNGGGRFDVIVGVKLNDRALTREEAEAIAAQAD
jgi:hypothetical protein